MVKTHTETFTFFFRRFQIDPLNACTMFVEDDIGFYSNLQNYYFYSFLLYSEQSHHVFLPDFHVMVYKLFSCYIS